jgi:hypothetical protein
MDQAQALGWMTCESGEFVAGLSSLTISRVGRCGCLGVRHRRWVDDVASLASLFRRGVIDDLEGRQIWCSGVRHRRWVDDVASPASLFRRGVIDDFEGRQIWAFGRSDLDGSWVSDMVGLCEG